MELFTGLKRSQRCAEVSLDNVGQKVVLTGWVQRRRDLGGLIFIDLRDRSGIVQIVINQEISKENFRKAETIRSEYVLAVVGEVVKRSSDTVNLKIPTGQIEVIAHELRILSKSEVPPFPIEENSSVNEAIRLKYRYMDLRRPSMQDMMLLRHKALQYTRQFFTNEEFWEIETPMLTKSTPEGARDYLVPSRIHEGKFYALPQSPQLFKQLLMVSGMDRYFQVARCFRDEDLRADRQPEFTQVDLEMSFVDMDDILDVVERYLAGLFNNILDLDIKAPFPRMTYKDAMAMYGSDKPDTRFDLKLIDLTDLFKNCEFKVFADAVNNGGSVRAINVKGLADKLSRRDIDGLVEFVKTYKAKGLAWIVVTEEELKSPIIKFLSENDVKALLDKSNAQPGDVILIVADKNKVVFDALGQLRLELGRRFDLIDKSKYNFLWVTEFPLFEYNEEEKRFEAQHHPFTMPMEEDFDLIESDPGNVRSKAFDIVLNGYELASGSMRIYNSELQERMFKALGFTMESAWERFGFLLDAFKHGTPPHGGMGLGFDRIMMLLAGTQNIKDVIAFPKIQNASCLLTDAPGLVDAKQLKELHIEIDLENTEPIATK